MRVRNAFFRTLVSVKNERSICTLPSSPVTKREFLLRMSSTSSMKSKSPWLNASTSTSMPSATGLHNR